MGDQQLHIEWSAGDPFHVRLEVPVAGGALRVARSGPSPSNAEFVVPAVHRLARCVARGGRELSVRTDACDPGAGPAGVGAARSCPWGRR